MTYNFEDLLVDHGHGAMLVLYDLCLEQNWAWDPQTAFVVTLYTASDEYWPGSHTETALGYHVIRSSSSSRSSYGSEHSEADGWYGSESESLSGSIGNSQSVIRCGTGQVTGLFVRDD